VRLVRTLVGITAPLLVARREDDPVDDGVAYS
jgi:hypothetical protein